MLSAARSFDMTSNNRYCMFQAPYLQMNFWLEHINKLSVAYVTQSCCNVSFRGNSIFLGCVNVTVREVVDHTLFIFPHLLVAYFYSRPFSVLFFELE